MPPPAECAACHYMIPRRCAWCEDCPPAGPGDPDTFAKR
jgi:hypothetical protein